ncbi:MAG: hypothetical protein JSS27_01750 [Planctomycetes bacterium]|nr:hypothetical protein [Planctomycetota bacterium]
MSYLDNGNVKIGVDLKLGGAITYFSPAGRDENVVNSYDLGRQIQMSHYSGPVPFTIGDKRPKPHWEHIGWNPIQTGDDFGHGSEILAHVNDGRTLYVKCRPMQWPLDNVPGECEYECWIELNGRAAQVRCRFINHRADKTQYQARLQELPAVYTNGPYWKLMTYNGPRPFTGGALTQIVKPAGEPGPWTHWYATERWSALVNDRDWGLGIYSPDCVFYGGGFAGKPGKGGPKDNPTGYMSPVRSEIIDHDIRYDYRYTLLLGSLDEIRAWVASHAAWLGLPRWHFTHARQGWNWINATDNAWQAAPPNRERGPLVVKLDRDDPQLISPPTFWQAEAAGTLVIAAAIKTSDTHAQVFWSTLAESGFSEQRRLAFPIVGDGKQREYRVLLANAPRYRGAIVQLRIDPCAHGGKNDCIALYSIHLEK